MVAIARYDRAGYGLNDVIGDAELSNDIGLESVRSGSSAGWDVIGSHPADKIEMPQTSLQYLDAQVGDIHNASSTDGVDIGMWLEAPVLRRPCSDAEAAGAAARLLAVQDVSQGSTTSGATTLGTGSGATTAPKPDTSFEVQLSSSPEALALYVMALEMKVMTANEEVDGRTAHDSSTAQYAQLKKQEDDWLNERHAQYKAAHPSLAGEIIKDVLTAAAAIADIGEGVGELLALDPQGLATISSGMAQAVSVGLQIAAQASKNPQEAAKLNKIADDINYAAMGLAVVGGAVDLRNTINAAGKISDAASNAVGGAFKMTDTELDGASAMMLSGAGEESGIEMDVLSSTTAEEEADGVFAGGVDEDAAPSVGATNDDSTISTLSKRTKEDFKRQIEVATDRMLDNLEYEFKGSVYEKGLSSEGVRDKLRKVVEKTVDDALKDGDSATLASRAEENASKWWNFFSSASDARKVGLKGIAAAKGALKIGSSAADATTEGILAGENHDAGKADVSTKREQFEIKILQNMENFALSGMEGDVNNQNKARATLLAINSTCFTAFQAAARAV
jgi:hypothetical protein